MQSSWLDARHGTPSSTIQLPFLMLQKQGRHKKSDQCLTQEQKQYWAYKAHVFQKQRYITKSRVIAGLLQLYYEKTPLDHQFWHDSGSYQTLPK